MKVYPESMNVINGTNITLYCIADSEESREYGVVWEFVKINSSRRAAICSQSSQRHGKYECRSEENNHTLFIHNLQSNDSGKYACIEDGGRGPGKGYLQLLITRKYSSNLSYLFVHSM